MREGAARVARAGLRVAAGLATMASMASVAAWSGPARAAWAAAPPDVAGQPVPFGQAAYHGAPGTGIEKPVVAMAPTPSGAGYWLAASDGGIFNYGDARFYGSAGGAPLAQPIVAVTGTPSGRGYWMAATDGGMFNYGDARFYGSTGGIRLAQPVVGMAATRDGKGYWLVASDGGIFSFGDARFYGSTGGVALDQPVVGMVPTADGKGYWLVAADGGIFSFGDARFYGSTGGVHLARPIVGAAATPDGKGYWLAAADGGVFSFGAATFHGSMGGGALASPIAGIAADPEGSGYWLLPAVAPPAAVQAPLQAGDTGPAVAALQNRLDALGYWVGPADGQYGDATIQAVYALQKAAGLQPDGQAGPQTEAALNSGVRPQPRSTAGSGHVVEIDLSRDLMMFVDDGRLQYTLNTSTGGGYTYTQDGQTDVAVTPQGHFSIYRAVDGTVTDTLGTLYRPRYFYSGYAIHGDTYVPPYPVSHGCARVSNEAIDWIWAQNLLAFGTAVWVY
ncbi:MAG TPA: peptidoglycan-binding protein [Acidimicrobiales bacterium]|nr:peptidoglycan-binding protein [Acidimicrobiales bacterium]